MFGARVVGAVVLILPLSLLLLQSNYCDFALGDSSDCPNVLTNSVTDPLFHWQEAVFGRRVPQPRLDPAQEQDGSPNEEED